MTDLLVVGDHVVATLISDGDVTCDQLRGEHSSVFHGDTPEV